MFCFPRSPIARARLTATRAAIRRWEFFRSHVSDWVMVVPGWGLWKAAHGCAAAASQPWMADRAEKQPPGWDDPPAAGVIQSHATDPLPRMGEEQGRSKSLASLGVTRAG